jgi:hypothetical protein
VRGGAAVSPVDQATAVGASANWIILKWRKNECSTVDPELSGTDLDPLRVTNIVKFKEPLDPDPISEQISQVVVLRVYYFSMNNTKS